MRKWPSWVRERDAWCVVLLMDPIGVRIVPLLAQVGISANFVTSVSMICRAAAVGAAIGGVWWGFFALWLVAFLLDCMDGQLARATRTSSRLGARLDVINDVAGGAALVALIAAKASLAATLLGVAWFGLWLGRWAWSMKRGLDVARERRRDARGVLQRWKRWTASRRLKPTPLTGIEETAIVVPLGLVFGCEAVVLAILIAIDLGYVALRAVGLDE